MLAQDVMTRDPVTVPPSAPVSAVARLFADRGISGAPVVDADGRLLGIISEGDLVRRIAATTEAPRSRLVEFFTPAGRQAARFAREHGRTAQDVMTSDVATAEETTPLGSIAETMEARSIRRVPVLRDGRLVGIVSRADLLRALVQPAGEVSVDAPDERIRRDVQRAMRTQPWVDAYYIFHEVRDGVVSFHGWCRNEEVKRALRVLAEGVPGVKGVEVMVEKTPLPVIAP